MGREVERKIFTEERFTPHGHAALVDRHCASLKQVRFLMVALNALVVFAACLPLLSPRPPPRLSSPLFLGLMSRWLAMSWLLHLCFYSGYLA